MPLCQGNVRKRSPESPGRLPGFLRELAVAGSGPNCVSGGVRFSGYRFEPATARLWSRRGEVHLTPKASAVLRELVTRAGEPVSKADLFAAVWNGTAVSDDALTSCVQELRRALSDDARRPRFIETRHRRGYRFMAPVTAAAAEPRPESAAHSDTPAADPSSVAVLAFTDMSAGRDLAYLCEGLAEELINALAQVEGLRVASRTTSFPSRGTGADVRDIGRTLGVGIVVAGSVRKAGDRLRVTVQVIEAATGYHRWSRRFDRTFDDVFALQDEIALCVAESLRGAAPAPKLTRPPRSVEPYEHSLRGRHHLAHLSQPGLEQSREMFLRAIAFDPESRTARALNPRSPAFAASRPAPCSPPDRGRAGSCPPSGTGT